nr:MAG TPA: Protein of unknown function (DUF1642) [Caudoviricetes sp.]
MNKRELIEHINNTLFDNLKDTFFTEPTISIKENAKDNKVTITFETEQGGVLVSGMLKKFEKVVIPQFVADWYEEHKDDFEIALFRCIDHIPSVYDEGDLNEFEEWIIDGETKPFQTLVNMHQFGYEVEKEKQYLVKIKGVACPYLNYDTINELWFYNQKIEGVYTKTKHTRKELEEAGFGWVFDCPGIEIEEVEE